jgi:hypothetical protein
MIDLERTLEDQKDLKKLCGERIYSSSEAYWPNDNYGLANVLKLYSGYPVTKPLAAMVPHGVYFGDDVHPAEAGQPLPAILSYPEFRDEAYRRGTNRLVIPAASPFLYSLELLGHPGSDDRSGTIFAPSHSTAGCQMQTDWYDLARQLSKLDEKFHPITVCMHWYDYQQGGHRPFEKRGFRIVSAGHLHDLDFLFRVVYLLSIHRYATSNDVGSHLFYSVAAGLPYFLVSEPPSIGYMTPDMQAAANMKGTEAAEPRIAAVRELFSEPTTEITPEQRACSEYYLGASRLKTPDDLLCDLQFAERQGGRPNW